MCVRACMRVYARACVCECVRVCARVCGVVQRAVQSTQRPHPLARAEFCAHHRDAVATEHQTRGGVALLAKRAVWNVQQHVGGEVDLSEQRKTRECINVNVVDVVVRDIESGQVAWVAP